MGKLVSLLDNKANMAWSFLIGDDLVREQDLKDKFAEDAFDVYRKFKFSFLHLIQYFKGREQLCVYFDDQDKKITFKLEANTQGAARSLFMPKDLSEKLESFSGTLRLIKLVPGFKNPYLSLVPIDNLTIENMANLVLQQSYQIDSKLIVKKNNQSLMVSVLPHGSLKDEPEREILTAEEYLKNKNKMIEEFFKATNGMKTDWNKLAAKFNLLYLKSVDFKYFCPCSKESMLAGIKTLASGDIDYLMDGDEDCLNVTCDYCEKEYSIPREEIGKEKSSLS